MSNSENITEPVKFDAILCRTNAGVTTSAIAEVEAGRKVCVKITGGFKTLRGWAFGASALMKGERTDFPELASFSNWTELCEHAESAEGGDVRPMVNLIRKYGIQTLFQVVNDCVDGEDKKQAEKAAECDVTIVTAHKAKGLEWDRVLICSDFGPAKDEPAVPDDETLRLMYVACTRARLYLDAHALTWVQDIVAAEAEAKEAVA